MWRRVWMVLFMLAALILAQCAPAAPASPTSPPQITIVHWQHHHEA